VSYGYRDAWLDETELAGVFGLAEGVYWDEQTRVDVSVRYDMEELIGHKVSVFLNLNNLTDETDVRYTGKSWNPNQVESYGRRYLAGFRYSL
jgi:outer membrane receptor protein involved in Fe transport